jgi:phosphate:Na+ symporter
MDSRIWMVFGGVGLFLIGMHLLETALSQLASRDFKLLLRRNTSNNARAVFSGIITTALLQSSSIVSFMTLAFAGSGIIKLQNALAVILGANIGTTISNWLIATLGFSFNIDMIWYPILGLGGIILVLFRGNKKIEHLCFFFIGLTFLFIALGFMKTGMLDTVNRFDFGAFNNYPPIVFVIIGFIITFLIQSSGATVAITLSALYAKAIPFHLAVAVIIGSELGTALKLVLAAVGSSPEKKRLAAGNILLNLVTTLLAFIFLYPLIDLVTRIMGISDPLQGLVAFQTVINVAATILFFPFLNLVSRLLEKWFRGNNTRSTLYIDETIPSVPGFAQEIFRLEVFYFLKRVLAYNAAEFRLSNNEIGLEGIFTEKEWTKEISHNHLDDRYSEIKKAQGEIIAYYVKMQKNMSNPDELAQVNQYMKSVQSAMHAAKGFKDINHNKNELLQSGNDLKFEQFAHFSRIIHKNLEQLSVLMNNTNKADIINELQEQLSQIQADYKELLDSIYSNAGNKALLEKDISTLQNMNRELYSANKSLIYAISDFMLDNNKSEEVKNLPLSIQ